MADNTFPADQPNVAEQFDRRGDPIPADPTFEEMEQTLREIEYFNELTETLLLLEIKPFRF